MWAVLHQLGRNGVTALLDRYLTTAAQLRALISDHPNLELVAGGPWSIVCFRYWPTDSGLSPTNLDQLTARIAEQLQHRGNAFLATVTTSTATGELLALRASVCNYQTRLRHLETLITEVTTIGHQLTNP